MAIAAGQYQQRGEWQGHDGDDPFHAMAVASLTDRAHSWHVYGPQGRYFDPLAESGSASLSRLADSWL